ncbi:MAG TPA: GNAT family N-acetyltransferase [Thermoanaerobaculaceae bacterium]|nr:GNAT family N-acetyltransferase [Thermoanaerobaculaceae bacterium]
MTSTATARELEFHPLTPDRWADLEALFGPRGACGGCWCMSWLLPRREFDLGKGAGNRAAFRSIVAAGDEPGILAYAGGAPVGWCAVAPRERYVRLERARTLARVDDAPVWSIVCFFIAKGFRRSGMSVALIAAAAAHARERGATMLEAYPVEPYADRMPAAFAWTGTASAFRKAGFVEAARRSRTRPIMRLALV